MEKSLAGELIVIAGLSSTVVPIALAGGAELRIAKTRLARQRSLARGQVASASQLEETEHAPHEHIGSSDITHVSRVVPTIV